MSNRSRDYYRKMRKKAIDRKKKIINAYRADSIPAMYGTTIDSEIMMERTYGDISPYWYVEHDGMLAKGKIHCSCGLCAFHGTTMQDIRKLKKMEDQLNDFYNDESNCSSTEILKLRNKIRKESNGRYYPNGGMVGTKLSSDKKTNMSAFADVIEERKTLDSVSLREEYNFGKGRKNGIRFHYIFVNSARNTDSEGNSLLA